MRSSAVESAGSPFLPKAAMPTLIVKVAGMGPPVETRAALVRDHRAQAAGDELGLAQGRAAKQHPELISTQAAYDVPAAQPVRQRAAYP